MKNERTYHVGDDDGVISDGRVHPFCVLRGRTGDAKLQHKAAVDAEEGGTVEEVICDEGVETVDAQWSKGTGDIESNLDVGGGRGGGSVDTRE